MMTEKALLKIGELSRKAGVTPRTIRFYVAEGLLPEPEKRQRNLAFYPADNVRKIRAIKKAQTERFLPLVVIRRLLEENDYDFSILEQMDLPVFNDRHTDAGESLPVLNESNLSVPDETVAFLKRRKIIGSKKGDSNHNMEDRQLLYLLSLFHQNGLDLDSVLESLVQIQTRIEEVARLEFEGLISGVIRNPESSFDTTLLLEAKIIRAFITRIRQRTLQNIVAGYRVDLDYKYLAEVDEGHAVQPAEILPELQRMEKRLTPGSRNRRLLNDLALGYSCLGNLQQSLGYLRRIRRFDPDDLETRIRWIWYRRFSRRPQDEQRMKVEMQRLVEQHPEDATARAFMAVWYAFDIQATDDPLEIFRIANLSLNEMDSAEQHLSGDIHEWVMVHFIKGGLCRRLMIVPGYVDAGITALEMILNRKGELDRFYRETRPFFMKWLWPNLILFLGGLYNQNDRFEEAEALLRQGSAYVMQPPYQERLQSQLEIAVAGK